MKKLGTPQHITWLCYLDCKARTKKKIGLPVHETIISDDERLIRFLLKNSSIVEHQGERAYSRVSDSINLICKQLCPGQWCSRSHCKNWSSRHAYHCTKTRPAVCQEYKKYIDGIKERKNRRFLIFSNIINDHEGCCGIDYKPERDQKLIRCYGDCSSCEELSNKQTVKL